MIFDIDAFLATFRFYYDKQPINCLADDDRNIRKNGLDTIKKSMNTMSK